MDDFSKGKLYIGADRDGYELKTRIREKLDGNGYLVIDLGVFDIDEQATYNDIAREVAEKVVENGRVQDDHDHGDLILGILFSADGGKLMASANQLDGARAFVADNLDQAAEIRTKFDANILCIGSEVLDYESAGEVIDKFLS